MTKPEHCIETFSRVVNKAGLKRGAKIAVSLSGGSDSLALLWLTRKMFDRVLAVTVDHMLRPESAEDARKAGELAASMDVEHCILRVNWEGCVPSRNAVQSPARDHRYRLMLDMCRGRGINTLMLGHHVDDQIETMLMRMRMSSGLEGLMGMRTLSRRVTYPEVLIVRPLLTCSKEDLRGLCREKGLQWVEDLSNHTPWCMRNRVRDLLCTQSDLTAACLQLHQDLKGTGEVIQRRVGQLLEDLPRLDEKYGYIALDRGRLQNEPRYIVWRLLRILALFLSGEARSTCHRLLNGVWMSIMHRDKVAFFHKTLLVPVRNPAGNGSDIIVCKVSNVANRKVSTKIEINQPILWENTWEITLTCRQGDKASTGAAKRQLFVRPFQKSDVFLARCGEELPYLSKLPHWCICATLPVVVDEDGCVVAIPHFQYVKASLGSLRASISFKRPVSLSHYKFVHQYH